MLQLVRDRVTDRKSRLFASACCRHKEPSFLTGAVLLCVEVAELHADGERDDRDLVTAFEAVRQDANLESDGGPTIVAACCPTNPSCLFCDGPMLSRLGRSGTPF
jgi:hypothetical protein